MFQQEYQEALNSLTKYPAIPTYHALGDRGRLTDAVQVSFEGEEVEVTEKINGANARILISGNVFIIGTREEFLWARGDLIVNPIMDIVKTTREIAERESRFPAANALKVIYGEVYGGRIGKAAKNYTLGDPSLTGFRMFDAFCMPADEVETLLKQPREKISTWREHGGQPFSAELMDTLSKRGISRVPRRKASVPPTDLKGTLEWLKDTVGSKSGAPLVGVLGGPPEGVVVRTPDRKKIAKIRYEDYERTLR